MYEGTEVSTKAVAFQSSPNEPAAELYPLWDEDCDSFRVISFQFSKEFQTKKYYSDNKPTFLSL